MSNRFLKQLRTRWKWMLRKWTRCLRRMKSKKKSESQEPPEKSLPPQSAEMASPLCPLTQRGTRKRLLKLAISLTELFRLIRLLVNLIRKNWDNSGKS